MLERKFIKIGKNSWGIIFPKVILELLKINGETDCISLKVKKQKLIIEKVNHVKCDIT